MRRLRARFASIIVAIASLSYLAIAKEQAPAWTKAERILRQGNVVTLICNASGVDQSLSFRLALEQCNSIAADQVNGYFESKSLVVETESESPSLHAEISSDKKVIGLASKVEREFSEANEDGEYKTTLRVRYDLKNARVVPIAATEEESNKPGEFIKNKDSASAVPMYKNAVQNQPNQESDNRHLILTTIPKAETIIVRGARPRTIRMNENPKTLLLYKSDKELVIRGPKGTIPKHIYLNGEGRRPADAGVEELEVYFEK